MSYEKIKVGREGGVTVITLADPATMNALGLDTAGELLAAYKEAVVGAAPARAILITGEGRGFCSGANLQPGAAGVQRSLDGDAARGRAQ